MWTIIAAGVIWGLMGGIATAYVRSLRWKRKQRGRIDFARTYIPIHPDLGQPDARSPGCRHDNLAPVTTESENAPVRYLCTSPDCYEEFEPDSGVAKGFLLDERRKELRRKADREFAQMFTAEHDYAAMAAERARMRRAEIAQIVAEHDGLSRPAANYIINHSDEVFTTGYQPSEWDNVR